MAIYNEILAGRFARGLQKLFGTKGSVPAKQLSGEVMPVLPLFFGAEARYLEAWNRYAFLVGVAAGGAGNRSAVRMRNPNASGVVVVFEKFQIANDQTGGVADNPTVSRQAGPPGVADLTTLDSATNTRMDNRGGVGSGGGFIQPNMIISHSSNVGAITGTSFCRVGLAFGTGQVDLILHEDQEITLLPGDAIDAYANTLNQGLTLSLIWRERQLEESERQ